MSPSCSFGSGLLSSPPPPHSSYSLSLPQFHDDSMRAAADYISQHAPGVTSVYVRAVATYALTLYNSNSLAASTLLSSLENLARERGENPLQAQAWGPSVLTAGGRCRGYRPSGGDQVLAGRRAEQRVAEAGPEQRRHSGDHSLRAAEHLAEGGVRPLVCVCCACCAWLINAH